MAENRFIPTTLTANEKPLPPFWNQRFVKVWKFIARGYAGSGSVLVVSRLTDHPEIALVTH
jgi:hypothetical protein